MIAVGTQSTLRNEQICIRQSYFYTSNGFLMRGFCFEAYRLRTGTALSEIFRRIGGDIRFACLALIFVICSFTNAANAQSMASRTSVGFVDSTGPYGYGYAGGYGYYGRYGYGWPSAYGNYLYQEPTTYLDYSGFVYRGTVTLENGGVNRSTSVPLRTDQWAAEILRERSMAGLPGDVISTQPVSRSLWLAEEKIGHGQGRPEPITPEVAINPAPPAITQFRGFDAPPVVSGGSEFFQQEQADTQPTIEIAPNTNGQSERQDSPKIIDDIKTKPITVPVRPQPIIRDDSHLLDATSAGIAMGRGDTAFRQGDYESARDEYLRATVIMPGDSSGFIALGLAQMALSEFDEAATSLREGVSISPGIARSGFWLHQVYGKADDLALHVAALDEYAASHPSNTNAIFLQGFVRQFSGQWELAIDRFRTYRQTVATDLLADDFIDLVLTRE